MKTNNRGAIQFYLLGVLVVAAIGSGIVTIKKGFGIFSSEDTAKAKIESVELVAANDRLHAAESEAQALREKADAAQAALSAVQQKRHDAVSEDVAGTIYALEQEPDPSLNVQAALTLSRSAFRNSDPISEARLLAMREQVKALTAQNVVIRKNAFDALAAKDVLLDAERAKEGVLVSEAAAVKAEKISAEAKAAKLDEQFKGELAAHRDALAELKTLGQKISSFVRWGVIAAILFVLLLWVLPLLARAFPDLHWLGWIAKKGGALLAGGLHALHSGEQKLKDEGLRRVGEALASARTELPEAAGKLNDIFDRNVTDPRLQAIIARAAQAVGGK